MRHCPGPTLAGMRTATYAPTAACCSQNRIAKGNHARAGILRTTVGEGTQCCQQVCDNKTDAQQRATRRVIAVPALSPLLMPPPVYSQVPASPFHTSSIRLCGFAASHLCSSRGVGFREQKTSDACTKSSNVTVRSHCREREVRGAGLGRLHSDSRRVGGRFQDAPRGHNPSLLV